MPSVSNWIKSYPDFEDLHLEIFGICGRFMKSGKCWILLDRTRRLQKMYPIIWNLRIPKQKNCNSVNLELASSKLSRFSNRRILKDKKNF